MKKLAVLLVLLDGSLAAQCNIYNAGATCPNSGTIPGTSPAETWAGAPNYQLFANGSNTSFNNIYANYAASPQPLTQPCAQVVPMTPSYIQTDLDSDPSCPTSGVCNYDNVIVEENYIRSLVAPPPNGAGLTCVDINIWAVPFAASTAYLASGLNYCGAYGTCYTTTSAETATLTVFTTVLNWLHSTYPSVKIHLAPTVDNYSNSMCGIATGHTGSSYNYTESQIQNCMVPIYAAIVKTVWVDYFSAGHEACGVEALYMGVSSGGPNGGCWLSVADNNTFIAAAATAIRATSRNPAIKIGFGATTSDDTGDSPGHSCASPGSTSYWCSVISKLMGCSGATNVLDYASVHTYPNEGGSATQYATLASTNSGMLNSYSLMLANVPACKTKVADEGGFVRWGCSTCTGDGGTYLNMPYVQFINDGSFAAWMHAYFTWARANRLAFASIFSCSEGLIMLSDDANNMRCSNGVNSTGLGSSVDNYDVNVMQALAALGSGGSMVSAEGLLYGASGKGPQSSLQGVGHLSGVGSIR